jgi:tRNA-dihydrouridine synthase C
MEGITDAPMRTLLTERGGFSFCVSEFLRINYELLPPHVFQRHVPELQNSCRTPSGTHVQVQLLGGHEEMMAYNAQRACELGAGAIDINFGCPSPLVNQHDGGASLLRYPQRIRSIVAAVRKVVPSEIPVSAKLRLGWDAMEDIYVNAEQACLGGASWLTIHGRTKAQGYKPPAYWPYIGEVRRRFQIPVVANGEIWNREDFLRCQEETGCQHFMIGRGALANPSLVHEMATELGIHTESYEMFAQRAQDWEMILMRFAEIVEPMVSNPHYTLCRIKQWLKLASLKNSLPWFDEAKRSKTVEELLSVIRRIKT